MNNIYYLYGLNGLSGLGEEASTTSTTPSTTTPSTTNNCNILSDLLNKPSYLVFGGIFFLLFLLILRRK